MGEDSSLEIHTIALRLSNAYLIQVGKQAILVDSGSPGESSRILSALQKQAVQTLEWIFLTHAHYDHMGSAAALREATGARIIIQNEDAASLRTGKSELGEIRGRGWISAWLLPVAELLLPVEPTKPDLVFGERFAFPDWPIEITAIHTPGHTLGSSILITAESHAFAGDLVSTTGRAHPQRYYAQDWSALEHSLRLVQEMRPAVTYPGHGSDPLYLEGLLQLRI